jgi:C_GCAxxG_C_C family probable redox protein
MSNSGNAVNAFQSGLHCAQAILSTYSGQLGLDQGTALKIAAGFGAGMARMQNTCGAVTGAVMVMGLKMIDKNTSREMLRDTFYSSIQEFFRRFREKNGTTECRDLLNCDLKTPEGQKVFHDNKLSVTVCEKCVRDAADLLDEMLKF